MADAGASSMILLVTSLLISGAASVVLLESWGNVAEANGTNAKEAKKILSNSDVSVIAASGMKDAAEKAVEALKT